MRRVATTCLWIAADELRRFSEGGECSRAARFGNALPVPCGCAMTVLVDDEALATLLRSCVSSAWRIAKTRRRMTSIFVVAILVLCAR
ncbi:hypothetical protein K466DRAFT_350088 [Polyporus arcularius HHB13444]|uniref:Uncharacterized protein n=1 Tax=Polyporus arcularius HHB13444 TaxID=1314778 RepID=A0A5C3NUX3_9APHY|nr:hypothetical protein K466DRAFT_350088 [Polyporus arcularius HHB13444]